jgi:capsular polysaccharide biosynthesis protein
MVPDEMPVEEQIRYFNAADVVVTPHGANSTNALYQRPGTSFVETFPRTWVLPAVSRAVCERGVHYLPVIQTPITSNVRVDLYGDYSIRRYALEEAIQNAIILAESSK